MVSEICIVHQPGSFKKVVYLQVEIERYGRKMSYVHKNLHNARLQKDHFGKKK